MCTCFFAYPISNKDFRIWIPDPPRCPDQLTSYCTFGSESIEEAELDRGPDWVGILAISCAEVVQHEGDEPLVLLTHRGQHQLPHRLPAPDTSDKVAFPKIRIRADAGCQNPGSTNTCQISTKAKQSVWVRYRTWFTTFIEILPLPYILSHQLRFNYKFLFYASQTRLRNLSLC